MRERWIAARRAEGRRRLRLMVAGASVAGMVGLAAAVFDSPLTSVHHLVIDGARHETAAQVEAVARVHKGNQLLWIDTGAAVRRLDALPWVAGATVERRWPTTVVITLGERQAVAQVSAPRAAGQSGMTVLVDATGRVLTAPAPPVGGVPVIAGLGLAGRPGSRLAPTSAEAGTLAVAALLPPPLAARLVLLSEKHGLITAQVLAAPGDGIGRAGGRGAPGGAGGAGAVGAGAAVVPVTFGAATDLEAKVTDLATVVGQVNLSRVTGIDLTIPGRPVLTGSPAPINVSTTAGG
jgi:cell division protein FtsQ